MPEPDRHSTPSRRHLFSSSPSLSKSFLGGLATALSDLVKKDVPVVFKPRQLIDVLRNQTAVMFLIDFAEQRNCDAYVHYWLMIDSFREVSLLHGRMDDLASDARNMYHRFLADDAPQKIDISDESREKLKNLLATGAAADVVFECLFMIQKEVYGVIDRTLYAAFEQSSFYNDMQKAVDLFAKDEPGASTGPPPLPARSLSTGATPSATSAAPVSSQSSAASGRVRRVLGPNASLRDFLVDQTGLFYFMQFMEKRQAAHWVNFWITVERYFCHHFILFVLARFLHFLVLSYSDNVNATIAAGGVADDDLLRRDAATLFSQYFAPDAPFPLRLPPALVAQLAAYSNATDPQLTFEVVLRAQKQVLEAMRAKHLKKFVESPLYAQYRREAGAPDAGSGAATGSAGGAATPSLGSAAAAGQNTSSAMLLLPGAPVSSSAAAASASGGTATLAAASTGLSPSPLLLGRIDDLGFYVSEGGDEDGGVDSFAEEIDVVSGRAAPSGLAAVFGSGGEAAAVDHMEEERQAREIARHILQEISIATNTRDDLVYLQADGL